MWIRSNSNLQHTPYAVTLTRSLYRRQKLCSVDKSHLKKPRSSILSGNMSEVVVNKVDQDKTSNTVISAGECPPYAVRCTKSLKAGEISYDYDRRWSWTRKKGEVGTRIIGCPDPCSSKCPKAGITKGRKPDTADCCPMRDGGGDHTERCAGPR